MERIAVLTSGGDGPGLNPCIRAVTRMALYRGTEVLGIRRGFSGLISRDVIELDARAVGGIMGHGGTFLGTARCPEFYSEKGQREALRSLNRLDVDGLVVIGGNGSLTGALQLHKLGFPVVGIPLPFLSYGGSSMIVLMIGVGLLMNVSINRYMLQS